MRYFFVLFFLFLHQLSVFSQNYNLIYNLNYKSSYNSDTIKNDVYLLSYSPSENISTFGNYFFYKNDSIMVSLKNKSDFSGSVNFDISSLSKVNFPLVSTKSKNEIFIYKYFDGDAYKIKLENNLNWDLKNEFLKIGNWECQKATVNYGNRSWIAWFSTEVSLQTGPYIFNNLPGLVIELKDTENEFNFTLMEITKNYNIINKVPSLFDNSIITSLKKYDRAYNRYLLDPGRKLRDGYIVDNNSGEVFHINGGFSASYIKNKTEEIKRYNEENNNFIER